MILVIDHYDSFVETLARYVREAGFDTRIIHQDMLGTPWCRGLEKVRHRVVGKKKLVTMIGTVSLVCRIASSRRVIVSIFLGPCFVSQHTQTKRAQPTHNTFPLLLRILKLHLHLPTTLVHLIVPCMPDGVSVSAFADVHPASTCCRSRGLPPEWE